MQNDKELVINYLNNLYDKIFENEERTKKWRYSEERLKIDNFLDCIEHVISYIGKEC
jgi:septation ring formation regulator EzrA